MSQDESRSANATSHTTLPLGHIPALVPVSTGCCAAPVASPRLSSVSAILGAGGRPRQDMPGADRRIHHVPGRRGRPAAALQQYSRSLGRDAWGHPVWPSSAGEPSPATTPGERRGAAQPHAACASHPDLNCSSQSCARRIEASIRARLRPMCSPCLVFSPAAHAPILGPDPSQRTYAGLHIQPRLNASLAIPSRSRC